MYVWISIRCIFFTMILKMHISARPVLHGGPVQGSVNMLRDENNIADLIYEEQICLIMNILFSTVI